MTASFPWNNVNSGQRVAIVRFLREATDRLLVDPNAPADAMLTIKWLRGLVDLTPQQMRDGK